MLVSSDKVRAVIVSFEDLEGYAMDGIYPAMFKAIVEHLDGIIFSIKPGTDTCKHETTIRTKTGFPKRLSAKD